MNTAHIAIFFACLGLAGAAHAVDSCEPRRIHPETFAGDSVADIARAKSKSIVISPTWNDARILQALGFADAKPEGEEEHGPDGHGRDYRAGKVAISITHSYSTGLAIMVRQRGAPTDLWHVNGCSD